MRLLRNFSRRWTISLLITVKIGHFSFFSGVYMTICKRYSIPNEDIINIVYLIEVKLDIGDGDIVLNDIIEHPINSEEDLAKIPELEEKAKKREEELKEKAKKLVRMASKLEDMGYVVVKPVLDEATGERVYKFDGC
jgi:hypothetical protein